MGERLLTPEELAALFRELDALIAEARMLQQQISHGLLTTRRRDRQDRSGQPGPDRRRRPRPK
jgi:hypothetical protein